MRKQKVHDDITQSEIAASFDYDPLTGILRWKYRADRQKRWNTRWAGKEAGSPDKDGYLDVPLNGRRCKAHRLIWTLMTGAIPAHDIDHENTIKNDNRWSNLREASGTQNNANAAARKFNPLGVKGIYRRKTCKSSYLAQIQVNGKNHYLGTYRTAEEAHAAYAEAATKHFGQFARTA